VDLIPRLHDLLFKVEEDLGEAGLFFGQGKHSFIDNLDAQCCADALAARVGYMKRHAGILAWLKHRGVGGGFDSQVVCGLHENEVVIPDRLRVTPKQVGIEVQDSGKVRCCREGNVSLAADDVDVTCEDRLALFYDIDVCSPPFFGRENLQMNPITCAIDAFLGTQQNLVVAHADLERN